METTVHNQSLPFECALCEKQPRDLFFHEPIVDAWITAFPTANILHIHFGRATHTQAESDQEGQWLDESVLSILGAHPQTRFYVLIDLSRADDSEFPSEKSREVYRSLLAHDQMYKAVFFGVTPAMKFLINTLIHLSGRQNDIFVEKDAAAGERILEALRAQG